MKNKFLIAVALFVLANSFTTTANAQGEKAKVLEAAKKAVVVLKNKDMKTIAALSHPSKGIRFSAFAYISKKEDLVFKGNRLANLLKDKKVYVWGTLDESEDLIKLTFAEYYKRFVYDFDFAKPDQINYNLKKNNGIMINNIAEVYPKGVEVEFFIEGTEDRMYGSLRLVFEKLKGKYFLVGIVRDTPGI